MAFEYKYIMDFDATNPVEIFPVWNGNQTKNLEPYEGQFFKRTILKGEFIFKRRDFDLVMDADFETKFTVNVFKREVGTNGIFLPDFFCYFYRTDLKQVDEDKKQFKVEPVIQDQYQDFLDSLDKSVDLRRNAPPEIDVEYYTQPVFQIYEQGRLFLTNVLGGVSFEQELSVIPTGGTQLITEFFFGYIGSRGAVVGEDLVPDVSGDYVDNFGILLPSPGPGLGWVRKDGAYRIEYDPGGANKIHIYETASGTPVYTADFVGGEALEDLIFYSLSTGSQCKFVQRVFWGRIISPTASVFGGDTWPAIPEDDIVAPLLNYQYVTGIGSILTGEPTRGSNYENLIICAGDATEDPTQYSKFPVDAFANAGSYYLAPTGDDTGAIRELGQSGWGNASFWFQYDDVWRALQIDGSAVNTMKAWKISDVVATMLSALGIDLQHEENTDYSDFLYSDDNTIRDGRKYPVIATKSNILVGRNAEPSRRAEMKFADILSLLAGEQVFPFIREGKLVFEHVQFFWNGGSYDGPIIGADLSVLTEPKTNLPWSHQANIYDYEREGIPGQIRASWMDQCSLPFDGLPIEPVSRFADQSKIEDIPISVFTSDIDFMQIVPERISKDGFFFGEAILDGGEYKLPFVELENNSIGGYIVQNGYASMFYIMDKYFRHNAPTPQIKINLVLVNAESVRRARVQEITTPSNLIDDQLALLTSKLGTGRVRSYSDRRTGGGATLILELPTQ